MLSVKAITFGKLRMYRLSDHLRLLVVATSIAAWFVASNHCALATTSTAVNFATGSECPMHAHKQHVPQPEKGNGCGDFPCCKNLQATTVITAKGLAKPVWLGTLQSFFPQVISVIEIQSRKVLLLLDTGPPGENNFTHLVLQRSVLAHAPPISLS